MATAALRRAMNAFTRPPDPTDAALLRQFADGHSEAAFAALVRRHGPLVLGVCRRMVQDRHLAEDAFQAAFVVLARRAGGIDPTRPLGPWLYGVAQRVALRARTMIGRRRKRETLAAGVPEVPHTPPVADDTTAILDEEIARLPDATREAVILCELQGLSRREAAKRLGIAEGTLSSRLAAARKVLAAKLRSRGVALSAALAGAAVLSPQLASAAVAAATGASLSSVVVSLADGASAMILLNKLKLTGVAVLFLMLSAGGFGPWRANNTSAAPVPKEKPEKAQGLIWFHDRKANELVAYTPDGRESDRRKLPADQTFISVTPDGKQILYAAAVKDSALDEYHLRPLDGDAPGTRLNVAYLPSDQFRGWTPDGKKFVRGRYEDLGKIPGVKALGGDYLVIDTVAKRSKPVVLPDETLILSWAPDGQQFIGSTVSVGPEVDPKLCMFPIGNQLALIKPNDGVLTFSLAPSADGQTQLVGGQRPGADKSTYHAVYRFDPTAKKPFTELLHEDGQGKTWAMPSPDGRHLAAAWTYGKKQGEEDELRLTVAKAVGTGRTTVTLRDKAKGDDLKSLTLLGWFPAAEKIKAPVSKEKDHGLVWFHDRKAGELVGYTPDGREGDRRKLPADQTFLGVTPDGKSILYSAMAKGAGKLTYHLRPFDGDDAGTNLGITHTAADRIEAWHPDGTAFLIGRHEEPGKMVGVRFPHVEYEVVDTAARTATPVHAPANTYILSWTPNGKRFVGNSVAMGKDDPRGVCLFSVVPQSEAWREKLTHLDLGGVTPLSLTPAGDGKTLLAGGWKLKDEQPYHAVYRFDPTAKKPFTELLHEDGQNLTHAVPSPDGTRLAAAWTFAKKLGEEDELRLTVAKADGTGRTTVTLRDKAKSNDLKSLHLLGWFKIKAPVPKVAPPEGVILAAKVGPRNPEELVEVIGLDGKSGGHLGLGNLSNVQQLRVSSDGKKLAFVRAVPLDDTEPRGMCAYPEELYVIDLPIASPPTKPCLKGLLRPSIAWGTDSNSLFVSRITKDADVSQKAMEGKTIPMETVLLDVTTKAEKVVELPAGHSVQDVAPDGKTLLTRTTVWHRNVSVYSSYLIPLDTLKPKLLGDEDDGFDRARFSPDGRRVAGTRRPSARSRSKDAGVFLADAGSGKVERVPTAKEITEGRGLINGSVTWSPDGKRLAVLWREEGKAVASPGGGSGPPPQRVTVMDLTGENAKTIREFALEDSLMDIDWADPKLTHPERKDDPKAKPPVKEPINAPVPKAKVGEELLISSRNGSTPFLVVSPDGKSKEVLPVPAGIEPATVRVSPDGRWAVYGEPLTKNVKHAQSYWPNRVRVIDLYSPDAEPRTLIDEVSGEALTWSADGKDVFVSRFDPKQIDAITAQKAGLIPMATTRVTLATGKETAVELPEGHRALAISPDGQTWLTASIDTTRTEHQAYVVTMKDGKADKVSEIGRPPMLATQFSADGKRAKCGTGSVSQGQFQLASLELATMKMTEVKPPDGVNSRWIGFSRWSADGSRLAFAWSEQVRDRKGNMVEAARVTVCDSDGSNPVTVAELEPGANIRGIDWMPARPAPEKKDDPKAKPAKKE